MKPLLWDAINPFTGQPFTWGDPNLRWGDPSYYLEPGDPGFVPYASTPGPQTRRKRSTMKHQSYYPTRHADQVQWLENFVAKIGGYASALGLDPATTVADIIKDARWVMYIIGPWLTAVRAYNLACTQAAKQGQTGAGGLLVLPVFVPPPLPAGVVPRDEGALLRIFDLVAEIKENDACTDAMCADLRLLGPEDGPPDFATLAPELTAGLSGGGVQIGWGWQGYGRYLDQCEIHVDRADGKGFVVLTFDTTPGYTDNHPHPATLTQWKYRAIYRVDDAQAGQWSAVVAVNVGG